MTPKWTTPAAKYGPTSEYGDCEAPGCRSAARTTCAQCQGEFCFGHGEHALHNARADGLHSAAEHAEGGS